MESGVRTTAGYVSGMSFKLLFSLMQAQGGAIVRRGEMAGVLLV